MNSLQGPGAAHHFVEYGKGLLEDPSSGGGVGCPPPYYYTHKKKHYEDFALKKSPSESCLKCEDSSSEELTPPPAQCSASEAPWHSSSLPGRPNHHHQRGLSPPRGAPLQGCDEGEKRRTEKCESEAVVIVKGGLKKAAGPSSSSPPSPSSPPTPSPSSSTLPPTSSSSSSTSTSSSSSTSTSSSSFGEDKCDLKVHPQQPPPPFPPEERERGVPSSAPATPRCQLVKSEEDPAAEPPPRERAPPNYKWVEPPTFLAPAPFPPQPLPVLASADPGVVPPSQRRSETLLDGNPIACFTIGGEPRLCLPQILNTVLRHFSLPQINAVCDELQIFCSRCTPRQLEYLKDSGVLPPTATSSGLITKTDAQRLTHALLYAHVSRPPPKKILHAHDKSQQIRISHSCFGKCKGAIWPEVYNTPQDLCIVCLECNNLYSPTQFVCHAHRAVENRTCHWGFDAENWREYIRLSKDQVLPMHKAELHLQQFKNKFDPTHSGNHKRKQVRRRLALLSGDALD
ncbi:UNVERIFIED_CONTAM: hypothetical protein GTU68_058666 [Idotea baltica]|nr:hypothetical protein [Idotea baltica]